VESGRADYTTQGQFKFGVPPSTIGRLKARYGPRSPAAKAGDQRFFADPSGQIGLLWMNTSRGIFRNVRLRKAVEYAIDRYRLATDDEGLGVDAPTDLYIPPAYPGFTTTRVYPLHADLPKARRLAAGHGGVAVLYAFASGAEVQDVIRELGAIGIDVVVKNLPIGELLIRARRKGEPVDLILGGFSEDYPDPADIFTPS